MACPTCGQETYRRMLKRHLKYASTGNEGWVFICQKCAARLHFGSLMGFTQTVPKSEIVVTGKKVILKKGRVT